MNALDSLFDFAALMSTSSAMTLTSIPNDSNESAQSTRTSKACSASIAPAQSSQVSGRMRYPPQQLSSAMHPVYQTENPIATFSRAHINSEAQHPIDWITAPPFSREMFMQGQHPLMPKHSRLPVYELPVVDCYSLPCSHHLSQPCACNYGFPPSRRYQQGSIMPSARNDQHVLLGQSGSELQYFRQPADVLSHEGHVLGQALPPHSFYIEDIYEPIAPHSTALQHKTFLDMGMDTRCQGSWSC